MRSKLGIISSLVLGLAVAGSALAAAPASTTKTSKAKPAVAVAKASKAKKAVKKSSAKKHRKHRKHGVAKKSATTMKSAKPATAPKAAK